MLPVIAGKESLVGIQRCLQASKRPDDVDSRPGAAAREASGDDLHSALGRSSAKKWSGCTLQDELLQAR